MADKKVKPITLEEPIKNTLCGYCNTSLEFMRDKQYGCDNFTARYIVIEVTIDEALKQKILKE